MDNVVVVIVDKGMDAAQAVLDALKERGVSVDGEQKKFKNSEIALTVKDVQEYLGIGKDKAYKLFEDKRFPSYRIEGRRYVRKDKFLAYLDAKCSNAIKLLK